MIVFDLHCRNEKHVFEAWFGSSDTYEEQRVRGLIICPFCGSADIEKAVMSPRISAKANQQSSGSGAVLSTHNDPEKQSAIKAVMTALAKAQTTALETSTWVGKAFDSQARAMDAGDIPTKSIHGQATVEQAKALIDDGIAVLPLPFPVIPPHERN